MSANATNAARLSSVGTTRGRPAPKLAAIYAGAALAMFAIAAPLGPLAWLCVWCGLSFAVLAYAYAVNRPAVFGKRRDGSLAPLSVALLWPYLLFVWGFFRLKLAGLRREPCWHRVGPDLYLGRRPHVAELPDDCTLVVDLTAEFPADRDVVATRRYRSLPTLNRHVPSDAELAALLAELRDHQGALYVHCGAGRGRSAMLAAALLVLRGQARDVAEAEQTLARIRPGVHLHPEQRAIIDRCCAALRSGAAPQSLAAFVAPTYAWSRRPADTARPKR